MTSSATGSFEVWARAVLEACNCDVVTYVRRIRWWARVLRRKSIHVTRIVALMQQQRVFIDVCGPFLWSSSGGWETGCEFELQDNSLIKRQWPDFDCKRLCCVVLLAVGSLC